MNTLGYILITLAAINALILFWLEKNAAHKAYNKEQAKTFRFFEGYFIGALFANGLALLFFVICKYLEA